MIKKFFRFLAAGLTAILILTVFCHFYYRWPIHIPNKQENTDYIWEPDYRWCIMTEGISWGKIDSAGYNNPTVIENPNVLILGSSHMEAKNVLQDQNTASVLQSLLGPDFRVYNKGISGHFFAKVCQYLHRNLELYDTPPKYVIIETDNLTLTGKDAADIMNHTVDFTPSYTDSFIGKLQKNPFLRHAAYVFKNGWIDLLTPKRPTKAPHTGTDTPQKESPSQDVLKKPYDEVFSYLNQIQQEFDTQIIIFYHPYSRFQGNAEITFGVSPEQALFSESCQENQILFLNMEEAFLELANEEHKLPHGFVTGAPGSGHLNKDGHRVIARELAEMITQLEEEKKTCQ